MHCQVAERKVTEIEKENLVVNPQEPKALHTSSSTTNYWQERSSLFDQLCHKEQHFVCTCTISIMNQHILYCECERTRNEQMPTSRLIFVDLWYRVFHNISTAAIAYVFWLILVSLFPPPAFTSSKSHFALEQALVQLPSPCFPLVETVLCVRTRTMPEQVNFGSSKYTCWCVRTRILNVLVGVTTLWWHAANE